LATVPPTPDRSFRLRYLALIAGRTRGPLPALGRLGLWLASLPYGVVVRLRNVLYASDWWKRERVEVRVISVGNLTVGGTGKTPCVERVADFYSRHDLRVAVLSRGYGNETGLNDESLVLFENLPEVPQLVGVDRVRLARIAIEELESEILVLDDGFQHRRLARDLDVVLIDATQPWGYGHLLPRGLLREPPSSLARAGVVVLTRCDQSDEGSLTRLRALIQRLAPHAVVAETVHEPVELVNDSARESLEVLHRRNVGAFCGLGNPAAFRATVQKLGANLVDFRTYPDHHAYSADDVEALRQWARGLPEDTLLLTTQKDLVKLRADQLGSRALWAVRIHLEFRAGREAFEQQLLRSAGLDQSGG
jgi:tetraacyldisaccharide 4'-kinase